MRNRTDRHPLVAALSFLLATALAFPVTADVLVRLPAGTDPDTVAAFAREVGRITGLAARGVTELPGEGGDSAVEAPAGVADRLERARQSYKNLEFAEVRRLVTVAERQCREEAAVTACRGALFDLNLLHGAASLAEGDEAAAAQAFRSAHAFAPSRVVDPRLFPPKVISAFNRACAAASTATSSVQLRSLPPGASFHVDGALSPAGDQVELDAGRLHLVEARLVGYRPRVETVEIGAGGEGPRELVITLAELPEEAAWLALRRLISDPGSDLASPGAQLLFARFGIDGLVLVSDIAAGASERSIQASVPGGSHRAQLVGPPDLSSPLDEQAITGLKHGLGLETTQPTAPPEPELLPPEPEDPQAVHTEDEEDGMVVDDGLPEETPPPEEGGTAAKVLRSPWLWISAAVLVGIVGGTVAIAASSD